MFDTFFYLIEGGVGDTMHMTDSCCCTAVDVPHRSLGSGAWKELQVRSIIPKNASGKQDCVIFCVVL